MIYQSPNSIFAITPSDSVSHAATRAIMVTGAGDVAVTCANGAAGVLPLLQPGVQYFVATEQVRATGTTATGIVGIS